jgi:hypothetical protein
MMSLLTASTTRRVLPRLVFDSIRTLATTGRGKKASSGPFLIDFASLRVFKAMHGHLKVPTRFSLSPDTPGVGWQAFGLGRHVDRLRYLAKSQPHRILAQDVVELDQMGFVWDAHKEAFQLLIEGMLIYHKLNGDFLVPIKFVVPTNDSLWPKKLWGMKIGRIFGAVRCEENLPLWQLQILKEHGIPCELYKDRDMMAERALTALQAYKLIMNIESGQQFTVHKNFTVPDEDPRWDPSLWGLQLGFVVSNIRCNGSYPEYHDRFRAVGLSLDNQYDVMAERILTALQAYKVNMNIEPGQEFTVPSSFVVPDGDARWDPALWGLPLGTAVSNIRSKNAYPDHHDKFRTVGLSFDNQYDVMAELILTALQAYKVNMNIEPGQEFTVPSLFKVPYEDVRWDPSLWGLALGTAVQSIRNSNAFPDHHERFCSIGLSLDNQYVVKGGRVLAALKAYKLNMNIEPGQEFTVPQSFKIPHDDERWDPSLWGMHLGHAVNNIRCRNDYPDYHERFRSVGLRLDKIRTGSRKLTQSAAPDHEQKDKNGPV